MIGIVLAAGTGSRLLPLTAALPKALLTVDGDRTILDIALGNLARAGLSEAVVVTGFASEEIEQRIESLQRRHQLTVGTVFNDRALEWNNAYSLWLTRELWSDGALLCNGDTVHPVDVEQLLLRERDGRLRLAIDDQKSLAEEEMKVILDNDGLVQRINKGIDPSAADGEYIGVTLIEAAAAQRLAEALEATWRRDTSLYYEDGFQEYADRGGPVAVSRIPDSRWVEVDNHDDLAKARDIACHY